MLDLGAQRERRRSGEAAAQPQHAEQAPTGREPEGVAVDDVDVQRGRPGRRRHSAGRPRRSRRSARAASGARRPRRERAATSVAGGRVDVTPKMSRKARPTIQPTSSEHARAASVMAPESKVVTSVAMTTVVAMGEIHLRPEMSATVSSASIETMTMSSGPVRPVDVGRVSTSVMKPPLPDWTRTARTMTRTPPTTAAPSAWISCIGRRRTSRSAPTPIGRSSDADAAHPAQERQQQSWQTTRGIGEVLLDRAPGAGGEVGHEQPQHEQQDRGGQADSVGWTADPFGDGWLDDLHVRHGSRSALVGGLSGSHPGSSGPSSWSCRSCWSCCRGRAPPFGAWSPPWCRPSFWTGRESPSSVGGCVLSESPGMGQSCLR